jgi:Fe-S oxidoreductase
MQQELPDFDEDLYQCFQCGYCTSICPMFEKIGWESASPRGKIFYLKQLKQKSFMDRMFGRKKKISDEFLTRIYQCTGCGACEEVCQLNLELHGLWKRVKKWIFDQGLIKIDSHKEVRNRIFKYRNPFSEPPENRGKWFPSDLKQSDEPEVVFFQGCTEAYRRQELAETTVRLLDKAKVPYRILGPEEWCCGSILINTGQTDYVKEYITHNVRAIVRTGAKTMIAACAGCYNTFKNEYPKFIGKLPFKVYHVSEYLEQLIKDKRLEFTKPINKTITFHDSCHLGRGAGVFDAPRNVIKSIPGLKLVEMVRNRRLSRCCGAGCGCAKAFNELASSLAVDRVKEAENTGAELIATTCPFCNLNMNNAAKENNMIKTLDVLQLAYQAI